MMRRMTSRPSRLPATLSVLVACGLLLVGCTSESTESADSPGGPGATATPTTELTQLVPGGPGDPVATVTGPVEVEVPGWTHGDLAFLQMMVVHHRQALEMSALAPERSGSEEVRALAGRIEAAQAPEILLMAGWLTERGVDVPQQGDDPMTWDHGAHGHDGMAGLLTAQEMAALEAAEDEEFDRLFLEGMIGHHEGALEMADDVLRDGSDQRILELAEDVIAGQSAEIARMRRLLD